MEWEYTTVPSGKVRRFACTSDRAEYNELLLDVPATSPWLMTNRALDASSEENYKLLELTVDGAPQDIRRASSRKTGQVYTVTLDDSATSGRPVRIRQVFRVVTPMSGHRLYFALPQPGRNLSMVLDYTNTNIAQLGVTETVASAKPIHVMRSPRETSGRSITVEAEGWLMPKTGFTFTWTLDEELPRPSSSSEAA